MSRKRPAAGPAVRYFLVQETNWEHWLEWEWAYGGREAGRLDKGSGGTPVKLFTDRDKAEAFREQQEQVRREKVNPFEHRATLADCTSFPPGVLHDWLLDAGLSPPTPRSENDMKTWKEWWARSKKAMTPEQRAKVWEALDKFRFFEVVELTE